MKLNIKRVFISTLIALLGLPLVFVPITNASWDTDDQHQIVPVYVYPSWWVSSNGWRTVLENSNDGGIGSTFIANLGTDKDGHTPTGPNDTPYYPGGGPGASYNSDYATIIAYAHAKGHNVLGYVDTNYGKRPLADVKADIDAWYSRYTQSPSSVNDLCSTTWSSICAEDYEAADSRIDGIFFDQVLSGASDTAPAGSGSTATAAGYYRDLFLYIKNGNHGDFDDVRANPGVTPSDDWMLKDYDTPTQIADEIMVFEGPEFAPQNSTHGFDYWTAAEWMEDYPASDFDVMVYSTPSSNISQVCDKLKNNMAGNVFVTSEGLNPTPWNAMPSATYYASFRSECD